MALGAVVAQPSWKDKYDENGKSKDDPPWMVADEAFEDTLWLSKYLNVQAR